MDASPGLRERKKRRTRETIAAAALKLFAERGFAQTTIADIAEAAEVAPRTFFAYFRSKEDVVFCDYDESFAGLAARLRDRPPGESTLDAMRAFIADYIRDHALGADEDRLRKKLARESEAVAAHDRHLRGRFEDMLAEAVGQDLGEPPTALRPKMVAAAAVAALFILDETDEQSDPDEDPMVQVDLALDFVRGGLAALQRP